MSTLVQIRTRVAKLLVDTGFGVTSSAYIDENINDAQREMASLLHIFHTVATTSSVSGTQEYSLATDYQMMYSESKSVQYVDSNSTKHWPTKCDFNWLFQTYRDKLLTETGTPSYYYIKDKTFGFYPTPNYSGSSNLTYRYFNFPATLSSDSTESDFNTRWTTAITYKATELAFEGRERYQEAQIFSGKFIKEFAKVSNTGDANTGPGAVQGFGYFGAGE